MSDALFDLKGINLLGDQHVGPLEHVELPGVKISLVYVTPQLAADYALLNAEAQRNKSVDTSATYASDMNSKEWVFIGDPIRFDLHGRMIDGQHRVEAIAMSGKSQWMIVITGLPEGVMRYVDMGRRRTYADTLKIRFIPNHIAVASLVRSIYYWDLGHYIVPNQPRLPNLPKLIRPSNAALDLVYDAMVADGRDPQIAVKAAGRLRQAVTSSAQLKAVTSAYHLFSRVDPFQAALFFDLVADKIEGSERITDSTFPPNLLRSRMSRSIQGTGEWLTEAEWLHMFCSAWNLWRNGRRPEALKRPSKPISVASWAYPDGLTETA